ncbi:hypothetical protein M1L60_07435 [Actinoplanes sp. TRM 88003]|uniref:Delta-60 repeat domain-containing protein n=1 Tax=Paractinoplanes aksuensis TaxID=2939490 RepID=A0ABT1DHZ0_9ACTN|nr:hypothetical protein [Actinoplanes aksuensis]MCO8270427.1 hypothetical protein [Actinoplanes aksuensis]
MLVRGLLTGVLIAGALAAPAGAAVRGPVLDPSFGSGGWVTAEYGGGDYVRDLALQPDGKIIAVGNGNEGYFLIERRRADGALDESFGTAGVVVTDVDPDSFWDDPAAMTLQAGGRILVAGTVSRAGFSALALVRYLSDGSIDTSFGTDGRLFPALGDAVYGTRPAGLTQQPDGKIVLGLSAATNDGSDPPVLLRLRPDGTPDPTFGAGGVVRTDLGPNEFESVTTVAVAPDGDIVVAGASSYWSTLPEPTADVLLARFTPRGRLDTSFGSSGRVIRDLTGPQGIDGSSGLAIGRDGRILQTVWTQQDDVRRDGLLRYLPDGKPDRSLGRNAFTYVSGPTTSPVLRPNGRIVTTGSADGNIVVAQYRANGSLDPSFGTGGVVTTDLGGTDRGTVLKIQPNGRLLIGGSGSVPGGDAFALVRYRP